MTNPTKQIDLAAAHCLLELVLGGFISEIETGKPVALALPLSQADGSSISDVIGFRRFA